MFVINQNNLYIMFEIKNMKKIEERDIGHELGDILGEARTLTGIIGIIFGFLLATTFSAQNLTPIENILLTGALFCSMLSLGIFSLPIIYHHIEFPYCDMKKFVKRFHRFLTIGFLPFILTFIFAIYLALERLSKGHGYFGVIAIAIVLAIVYHLRR